MYKWKEKNNLENYTGRSSQKYELFDDHAEIWLKHKGGYIKTKIDLDDVDRCKKFGTWTYTLPGYVVNRRTGMYLHRFVTDCPDEL